MKEKKGNITYEGKKETKSQEKLKEYRRQWCIGRKERRGSDVNFCVALTREMQHNNMKQRYSALVIFVFKQNLSLAFTFSLFHRIYFKRSLLKRSPVLQYRYIRKHRYSPSQHFRELKFMCNKRSKLRLPRQSNRNETSVAKQRVRTSEPETSWGVCERIGSILPGQKVFSLR